MGGDIQRQYDLTRALERATKHRHEAELHWREVIAEAHAAGVPRLTIMEAAGSADSQDVQEILSQLDHRKA